MCLFWVILALVGIGLMKRNPLARRIYELEQQVEPRQELLQDGGSGGNHGQVSFDRETGPTQGIEEVMEMEEAITVGEALQTWKFYHMALMIYCSAFYGMYMAVVFKNFGSVYGNISDSMLTLAGSLGAACNGLSRVFWATLFDKFGFKIIFGIIVVTEIIISSTIFFVVSYSDVMYVVWVCIGFCWSLVLPSLPGLGHI